MLSVVFCFFRGPQPDVRPPPLLVVDGVDDDAGIEEVSGHGSAGGDFLKAPLVFLA